MVNLDKRKFILEFIKKHSLAVISTCNTQNKPQSAVIEFGQTDDLEIIFDTFSTYRKYKNIKRNPHVSLVIGWDEDKTVQYEGKAIELSGREREEYKKIFFKKLPKAKKFERLKEIKYFKVMPLWIRYTDLLVNPWQIFEIKL